VQAAQGVAKIVEGTNNAKLKVAFFRPFYGNYWVLALGANYDWVLVGEPKREFGWVLSRNPVLDSASLNAALNHAEKLGYSRNQFVASAQTQPLK
jgi:apolipoprotein D and lipocalin family protein